jgi:tetratricopeptide (TPR) repeat protein
MMRLWSRMFRNNNPIAQPAVACALRPARSGECPAPLRAEGSPSHTCLPHRENFPTLAAPYPASSHSTTRLGDAPEWFAMLRAHVTAIHANDTAVRLFREGQIDAAIAELRRGLEVNPQHPTGYSNLRFLYLRKGLLEPAVECLLRTLKLDPRYQDAADHLFDMLRALIDELVQIGLTDGFLASQPEDGIFDEYNRHRRTRDIGHLIAKIGQQRIFMVADSVLEPDLLLRIVVTDVQKKMGYGRNSITLPFAWQGIYGWSPPVAVPLWPAAQAAGLRGDIRPGQSETSSMTSDAGP